MENNRTNPNEVKAAMEASLSAKKQPYHAPKLIYYGELVELVQSKDKLGTDGGSTTDCTNT